MKMMMNLRSIPAAQAQAENLGGRTDVQPHPQPDHISTYYVIYHISYFDIADLSKSLYLSLKVSDHHAQIIYVDFFISCVPVYNLNLDANILGPCPFQQLFLKYPQLMSISDYVFYQHLGQYYCFFSTHSSLIAMSLNYSV